MCLKCRRRPLHCHIIRIVIHVFTGCSENIARLEGWEFFLQSWYSIKARQSEQRVSVASMLVQYACKRSCVIRRMRK